VCQFDDLQRHVVKVLTGKVNNTRSPSFLLRSMPFLAVFFILTFSLLALCQSRPDKSFSLSQPFTSNAQNFDVFGSATMHSDTIVLTPHSPSHLLGAIWAKNPNPHTYWEADFSFRASGAERGGMGLAFWYSAKRGLGGEVFGSIDQWDGLGLFFDGNTGGRVLSSVLHALIEVNRQRSFECWRCTI
jgi:Legume-like lectin family